MQSAATRPASPPSMRRRRSPARPPTSIWPRGSRSARGSTRHRSSASPTPSRCISVTAIAPTGGGGCTRSPTPLDPGDPASRLSALCEHIAESRRAGRAGTRRPAPTQTPCSTCAPSSSSTTATSGWSDLPSLLLPRKGRYGLIDYEKAFAPDWTTGAGHLRPARHRPRTGCARRGAPRPIRRPRPPTRRTPSAGGLLGRFHPGARDCVIWCQDMQEALTVRL